MTAMGRYIAMTGSVGLASHSTLDTLMQFKSNLFGKSRATIYTAKLGHISVFFFTLCPHYLVC